jgi:amidase
MTATQSDWQEVAAKKRAELLASIPSEWLIPKAKLPADDVYDLTTCRETCGILSAEELKITAASASEIAEKCAKGIWKAEPVAVAFCKAAAVAHQLVVTAPRVVRGTTNEP